MDRNNKILKNVGLLEKKIGYLFKNKEYISVALTHSSYANEVKSKKIKYNERIEFLGDSILSLVISEYLFNMYPNLPEGELTVTRAKIVCENSLAKCANDMDLGNFLLLGKGEELTGGRTKSSVLCDAVEALIGAIYLDSGLDVARTFILKYMEGIIKSCVEGKVFYDYKTQLQEKLQQNGDVNISYAVIDEKGPDHNKVFVTELKINGDVRGKGEGRSKKESEQNAAKNALESMKN